MWHRLALALGGRTVEEWQDVMSSAEFTDWIASYKAEPFGYEVDNYRFGTQTAAIVNQVAGTIPREPGRSRPKARAQDYYPSTIKGKQVQLTPEQKAFIRRKRGKRGNSSR